MTPFLFETFNSQFNAPVVHCRHYFGLIVKSYYLYEIDEVTNKATWINCKTGKGVNKNCLTGYALKNTLGMLGKRQFMVSAV